MLQENNQLSEENLAESDDLYEHVRIVVDKGQTLLRLDKFLMDRLPNVTRNKLQNAIRSEAIQVNNQPVKVSYKVRPNDIITVTLPDPPRDTDIVPENVPLTIIYEDDDLLLVNKEAGMVVHPAYSNWTGTLVNALSYYLQNLPTGHNAEGRPGLVHRIDKDTSGLLVIAKTEYAMSYLARQFFDHSIERTYYALIWGVPKEASGTIRGHIGRSLKDRKIMAVYSNGEQGKPAITHYQILQSFQYVTLIKCNLETGRTHQIRAHFKHIGHPLFGDTTYGGDKQLYGQKTGSLKAFVDNTLELMPRQALHAKSLGFRHPTTKQMVQFDSDLPADFTTLIDKWKKFTEAQL